MELRLSGHFSYIDGNKLIFAWLDEDPETKRKLTEHCIDGTKPYNKEGFTVLCGLKIVPDDIRVFTGLECAIWVNLKTTIFKSKYDKNFGATITHHKLILSDIKRL